MNRFVLCAFVLAGCEKQVASAPTPAPVAAAAAPAAMVAAAMPVDAGPTADYTCEMHPEVSEPQPGKCPKCGMTLVRRPGGPR